MTGANTVKLKCQANEIAENKKVWPFFFSKSNTVSAILFLVSAFFYFIKWSLFFKGDDVSPLLPLGTPNPII